MQDQTTNSNTPEPVARLIRDRQLAENFSDDILIAPSYERWDDFGYKIRAEIGLMSEAGTREWVDAFFALKDQKNLASFVRERLKSNDMGVLLEDLGLPFASLFIESKSYSLVRRAIGADVGRQQLLALHDVSLLQSEDEEVPNWPAFFTTDVFTHAMTRSSEGHFAFRHGAIVLAGRRTSGVDAQQSMAVDLTRYGPKLHFNFEFDSTNMLRGRIAVIVGKNGCGKTTSLSRLAAGLATDKRQGVSFFTRPEVNQVLVFAHSGALRLFKQRRDRPGAASVRTFALDPSSLLRSSVKERQTKLLVDIGRADDADFRPLDDLKKIIAQEFTDLAIYVPIKSEAEIEPNEHVTADDRRYVNLKSWMRGGEGHRLSMAANIDHDRELLFLDANGKKRSLSLGQAAFLNFSLNALANAGPASVLLIDEPENFLHPNLVSRFMRVLHRIVEGTKSIAILATHSPFVVREVQSAQVHVIRQVPDTGNVEVVHPRLQTLGANVASISDEVFGDDLPEHLFEMVLGESSLKTLPFDRILEQFAGQLSTEALMFLRRNLPLQKGEAE